MLISEGVQTSADIEKKYLEERIVREGMQLLKKQKEEAKRRKIHEQQEMKEMLDRYWPWGKGSDAKPRGLRNLRLEELFPDKDYQINKRFVGTMDIGRGGGGAPMVRDGHKVATTTEDPMLRFQFGSKDLRKEVDNTLRYKTNRQQQTEYKKELDKLVEEKKQNQLKQKLQDAETEKRQGWSNEETLKKLEQEEQKQKYEDQRNYEHFRRSKLIPPNRVIKLDPIIGPTNSKKNFVIPGNHRKLSPLSNGKENGMELVTLLAKDRRIPVRVPLSSTDVTKHREVGKNCIWNRNGSAYLKELTQQMVTKKEKLQELKVADDETARRHFSTWTSFWGKPGHGAPRSAIKKGAIDRLLYPQMVPLAVA